MSLCISLINSISQRFRVVGASPTVTANSSSLSHAIIKASYRLIGIPRPVYYKFTPKELDSPIDPGDSYAIITICTNDTRAMGAMADVVVISGIV